MNWMAIFRLELELRRWRRLGRSPQIWWRDDDARKPTPALDRLLDTAGGRPLALAVVPDGDLAALAARLATAPAVTISQHGVDHENRRRAAALPNEYPAGATADHVAARIAAGRGRLEAAGLAPAFYTPPWNQIDETLALALPRAGFQALSAAMPARPVAGMVRFDSHIDILRWKGAVRFRGYRRVLAALTRQLRRRRRDGDFEAPIGLLTHHLVHDEAAWRFLAWFTRFARRDFVWRSFADLAGDRPGRGAL
jgi:hypothetical protein